MPFTYLDSPMAEFLSKKYLLLSISAIFKGKKGVKVRSNLQTLGISRFWENLNFFQNFSNTVCVSLNTTSGKNFGKIWQPPQKGHLMDAASPQKHLKIYNYTNTNATLMKLTMIMYLYETFHFTKDWGITQRT